MTDRRTRLSRIAADMRKFGVTRTVGVAFSRVRTAELGVPIFSPLGCFIGGDSIDFIAMDVGLTIQSVENAIRFALLYPRYDTNGFWEGMPDHMPPKETANV